MITIKNCTKSQKEIYTLLENCVDDLATYNVIYIFDTKEDMMEKFEELKHQDIELLIDEDKEYKILENTDKCYRSIDSDGTIYGLLCTRRPISK